MRLARVIRDPETGEPYYPIGCEKCGSAQWWVCSATHKPAREFRVALVCAGCTHASKGRVVMDERTLGPEEIRR